MGEPATRPAHQAHRMAGGERPLQELLAGKDCDQDTGARDPERIKGRAVAAQARLT